MDFGAAALRLTPVIAFSAWTQDGRPVDGGHVTLPVRLNLGDEAAAAKP